MIAKLRHRLLLCRQEDVVMQGDWYVRREGVTEVWAGIETKRASTFSARGAAYADPLSQRSHVIHIRYQPQINISSLAWLYERRLQSSPRWFKILATSQTESKGSEYFRFDCRVVERGDDIAEPEADEDHGFDATVALPEGLKL